MTFVGQRRGHVSFLRWGFSPLHVTHDPSLRHGHARWTRFLRRPRRGSRLLRLPDLRSCSGSGEGGARVWAGLGSGETAFPACGRFSALRAREGDVGSVRGRGPLRSGSKAQSRALQTPVCQG